MTKTTDQKKIKSGSPLPGILIAIGAFIVAISGGSMDYYYAAEDENQALGYEKNEVDYQQSKREETRGLILGGTLVAAGLIALKRKESQK